MVLHGHSEIALLLIIFPGQKFIDRRVQLMKLMVGVGLVGEGDMSILLVS